MFQAGYWIDKEPSAPEVCNRVSSTITDWCADGRAIQTAKGVKLDTKRMEFRGETYVYSDKGKLIVQRRDKIRRNGQRTERIVRLKSLETAFGEDPGRSLTRSFEKLVQPASRTVDWRCLSMMFWMDVAWQIETGKWVS